MNRAARAGAASLALAAALWLAPAADAPASSSCGKSGASAHGRPRIGLVLGGGGARGAAHIGVLKVLEALRVPVDCVAGTSMGSIVGGLYASGMPPDEIERQVEALDWSHIFDDSPPRPDRPFRRKRDDDNYLVKKYAGFDDGRVELPLGWVHGRKFDVALARLTEPVAHVHHFDNLAIPFRAVATDIETGEAVVLGSGNLPRAIRASMAVPGAFDAVEIDGRLLVDGFVANNVPVDVARAMGADVVIVVDVGTPLMKREEITTMLSIVGQLSNILSQRNVQAQLATLRPTDVLIQPKLGNFPSSDFGNAATAIAIGEAAGREAETALAKFGLADPDAHASLLAEQRKVGKHEPPVVEFIEIVNLTKIGDDVLRVPFERLIGKPLDHTVLQAGLDEVYGWDIYENVRYDVIEERGRRGLRIHVKEKAWGPNYLQLGMALATDFDGESSWNLGASVLKTALNRRAGELRTALQIGESPLVLLDFYQPVDVRLRYFIEPVFRYDGRTFNFFDGDDQLAEYRVNRYGGGLMAGRVLGRWGEFRLGLMRDAGQAELRVGAPAPDIEFDSAELIARLMYDTLDNRNWPSAGALAQWQWVESVESLGGDTNFTQTLLRGIAARTWGRYTLLGGLELAYTAHGDAPLQNRTRLGGFTMLSGFTQDQLSGQHAILLRSGLYRRVGDIQWLPLYAGMMLEYGNVYERRSEISLAPGAALGAGSLFFGTDTILGPVYLGYGYAEGGNSSVYFNLGRLF